MDSPYSVLGVSPNATPSEIESAYAQKWRYWSDLTSIPKRAAEAKEMKAQLDVAREQALAKFMGQDGILVDPELVTQGFSAVGGGFASLGGSPREGLGKDACPKCGKRDNPPDADYCASAMCDFELRPPCPKCGARVPWYQGRCHKCGVVIEEFRKQKRKEEEAHRKMQVQEIMNQLQELRGDLAWVQSRRSLSPRHSESAKILSKYHVEPDSPNTCLMGVILLGGLILFPIAAGRDDPGLIWLSLIMIVLSLIAASASWRNSYIRNKTAVQHQIWAQITEIERLLPSTRRGTHH